MFIENHMKRTDALRGQISELINVEAGGTYRNHFAFKC
jgi:hypothetical protein